MNKILVAIDDSEGAGYQMLAIGRYGYLKAKRLIMGSVAAAVINRGEGMANCVVE